jgi:glucose-1-phosphate cytidylyltransferase
VILAGRLGTRISKETFLKTKLIVDIGCLQILGHILKIFGVHGFG